MSAKARKFSSRAESVRNEKQLKIENLNYDKLRMYVETKHK